MLLYHFTTRDHVRSILQSGLTRGAVHTSAATQLNAVWLTTDPGPDGHGLEWGADFMSDLDRREAKHWSGKLPPPGARFPKEASVRITVALEAGDRNLHEWLPWARRQLKPDWMAYLHPVAGGNLRKAKTWRLYFGIIPPAAFAAVEELSGGAYQPLARPALPQAS
jgi:hypothetical protein